jgi:hypothetical protein
MMNEGEVIHGNLMNAIKQRFPNEKNIGNVLMDILCLGKESVYRRIRGEVPFTLFEVATIAKTLDFSLDNILGTATNGNRPFQLVLTDHVNPSKQDLAVQKHYINFMHLVGNDPDSEAGCAVNVIPMSIAYNYSYLSRLYAFKYAYQRDGAESLKSYSQIHFSKELIELQRSHYEKIIRIRNSFYILDNLIFLYVINDIKYFSSIRMIEKEEVKEIKDDLSRLVDNMEELVIKGYFESGVPVNFYISNINFDTTYSYIGSQNYNLCMINAFSLDRISSLDMDTFGIIKRWVQSLKRCATLISESGEVQRVAFFKKQRELINTLDTCTQNIDPLPFL